MVYEVCALVLTIIFSMVGVYLVIVLHATKGLLSETRQALKTVNEKLPVVLSEMQYAVIELGTLTETVRGGIEQINSKVFGPIGTISSIMDVIKLFLKIWRIIRKTENKMEST